MNFKNFSYEDIFLRTEMLIGKEKLEILRKSKVAIIGIGGVGSYAAEGLARSGVGTLILVDNECIDVTNINRQIHSNISTVGKPKVDVMKERIQGINPESNVIAIREYFNKENADFLIKDDFDYIVDAIDSIESKIQLIIESKKRNISIISSMGAGNKLDPTKFTIADIYNTDTCPLARVIRKELRKRNVESLKVVYSKEVPVKSTWQIDEKLKAKIVPASISFVPSVAGLIIAGAVINDLVNKNK